MYQYTNVTLRNYATPIFFGTKFDLKPSLGEAFLRNQSPLLFLKVANSFL